MAEGPTARRSMAEGAINSSFLNYIQATAFALVVSSLGAAAIL